MEVVEGWLLDCYPSKDSSSSGMTFWLKQLASGKALKLKDSSWHASIYASGEACDNPSYVSSKVENSGLVHSINLVRRRINAFTKAKSPVLQFELSNAGRARSLAERLEGAFQGYDAIHLYNVDVLPEQQYFYEKDLFPLARVRVRAQGGEVKSWQLLDDSVESLNYEVPALRCVRLDAKLQDRVPGLDSKLNSISLEAFTTEGESKSAPEGNTDVITLESSDEAEILAGSMREIDRFDPDLLITRNGDSFVLPYLRSKAAKCGVSLQKLDRDAEVSNSLTASSNVRAGKTYFSYGRILYRPATQRLFGRLHLDEENTFVYDQCRLQGLFEVSRLCRMPMHTSMRASIGKCLSGLQFYNAFKQGLLIPWKPEITEDGKNGYELFKSDRGGLVFNPLPGIHEHIFEIDFASLYPSIIRNYNISAETVNCACCRSGSRHQIEELGMHICEKRKGIVASSLELPLEKRFAYKRLRDSTQDRWLKSVYNERAGALKWILVCCFGYLSYRNAKFGKIDSHIAVCAQARKTLLDALHTAEYHGFRMIHGIVDSLWIAKDGADMEDCKELCKEIEAQTGFKLAIEGQYRWIVFLPSKTHSENQVANRYFGRFEDKNEGKVRGIELRRHDTPPYFKKCQGEILQALYRCDDVSELRQAARTEGVRIFEKYAEALEDHMVPPSELLIRRRLSKNLDEYFSKRQLPVSAASKLSIRGLELQAGQSISYVITRYRTSGRDRSIPEEIVTEDSEYDSERYVELLSDCCATVLSPFGVTKERLLTRAESTLT